MPNRDTWLKNLSNKKLSKKEKFIKIKEKAREIEELALRKEQLLNLKNDPLTNSKNKNTYSNLKDEKNIEDTLEVNEMLIDAIKAKLAILDDIN